MPQQEFPNQHQISLTTFKGSRLPMIWVTEFNAIWLILQNRQLLCVFSIVITLTDLNYFKSARVIWTWHQEMNWILKFVWQVVHDVVYISAIAESWKLVKQWWAAILHAKIIHGVQWNIILVVQYCIVLHRENYFLFWMSITLSLLHYKNKIKIYFWSERDDWIRSAWNI